MNVQRKSLISVHIAVLLFGISGLIAKLVDLPSSIITLGRVVFSSLFLFIWMKLRGQNIRLKERKDYVALFFAGIMLAVHWTTFMLSIQLSTVAIGTLTFSTFPLFVTFLEPYMFHEKLKKESVASAVIMFLGVLYIVPEFTLGNRMTQGIVWGLVCSLSYSFLSLWNRKFAAEYTGKVISMYEQGAAAIVLLPALFIFRPHPGAGDITGLILYGVVCTAIAHSMFIEGLKHIRVQTAGIISGLESVYGIVAAVIILHEIPTAKELIGGAIILGVVFYTTLRSEKEKKI